MRWGRLAWVVLVVAGCGGSVDRPRASASGPPGSTEARGDAGPPGPVDGGVGGGVGDAALGRPDAGAVDAGSPFVDPGCPDVRRRPGSRECDPLARPTGCPTGERCVPYVEYTDRCETEEHGTRCAPSGDGVQGDSCEDADCGERHVCVTTGEGSQCVRLCSPDRGAHACPPGLICQSLDVDGYFICF